MLRAFAVAGAALAALAIGMAVRAQVPGQYLVSDWAPYPRITHCVYTRAGVAVDTPAEQSGMDRRCKVDLLALKDPKTGTVTVAFKDAALGEVGPSASFTFPVPLSAPAGLRLSN